MIQSALHEETFRDLCTVGISTQYISGFAIGCSSNWATENSCQWGNMPGPRGTGVLNAVWTNNSESVVCGARMMWFSKWHRHTQKKELQVLPTGVKATTFTLALQMLYHGDIGDSWYARSLNFPNTMQEICHHGPSLICQCHLLNNIIYQSFTIFIYIVIAKNEF